MAVDGTYNVSISTPMGARSVKVTLKADGDALTGSVSGEGYGEKEFSGKADGDNVSWEVSVPSPMGGDITLSFSGVVSGDELSGNVQLGSYGTNTFSGKRV